jgi:hypothetical protein
VKLDARKHLGVALIVFGFYVLEFLHLGVSEEMRLAKDLVGASAIAYGAVLFFRRRRRI